MLGSDAAHGFAEYAGFEHGFVRFVYGESSMIISAYLIRSVLDTSVNILYNYTVVEHRKENVDGTAQKRRAA